MESVRERCQLRGNHQHISNGNRSESSRALMYKCSTVGSGVKNKLRGLSRVGCNKRTVSIAANCRSSERHKARIFVDNSPSLSYPQCCRKPRGSQSTRPFESHFFPKSERENEYQDFSTTLREVS